jgi:alpha-ketoglutarate-dependent taurine dioxygenase
MFTARTFKSLEIPLIIEPTDHEISREDTLSLLQDERSVFHQKLLRSGALLFRNFPIENADDFDAFISALGLGKSLDYIGGDSPRNKIKGGIYTSTEAPPSVKILLHNELSYVKQYPRHIYFYCDVAPAEKGETIIADARKVLQSIHPEVKQRFIDKGINYVSCYHHQSKLLNRINPSHKSWTQVFEADSKEAVEKKCREAGFSLEWNRKDWLRIKQTRPATLKHPETGEEVWFNQAHLYDFNPKFLGLWKYLGARLLYLAKHTRLHEVSYGDGDPISKKDLYHVMDALEANTVYFPWQKGDVLVLDNVLAMHGRATFSGKRRILTAMTS